MKSDPGAVSLSNVLNDTAETRSLKKRKFLALGLLLMMAISVQSVQAMNDQTTFKSIPTQFIAALGDPDASSGKGAQSWGLWSKDPGPRGVRLKNFDQLQAAGGVAPAQWKFDQGDWWLEENVLIMEQPDFPVPPGKYIVTGDREMMAVLTVHPADENGERRWELDKGAKLYDVTHLPCRSARYRPIAGSNSCSPARADRTAFRVRPGAPMPEVEGCNKQDYAVLFVIAVAVDN
ncbi:MAG: hypothetical protein WBO58_10410 [Gammaproteobacteria bacterium]